MRDRLGNKLKEGDEIVFIHSSHSGATKLKGPTKIIKVTKKSVIVKVGHFNYIVKTPRERCVLVG